MKPLAFIFLITCEVAFNTACEPAHRGGYDAPSISNDGEVEGNIPLKIDSSIERAVAKDSLRRRTYNL